MSISLDKFEGMGLSPTAPSDESLKWGNWQSKEQIQTKIKRTDTNLNALGPLWRANKTSPTGTQVACNAPVQLAKVSTVVTLGSQDGTSDRNLPEGFYLCKEETAT